MKILISLSLSWILSGFVFPVESKAGYDENLAFQNTRHSLSSGRCFIGRGLPNMDSTCYAKWVGAIYVETIRYGEGSLNTKKGEFVNRKPSKSGLSMSGVEFREGDLIYSLDVDASKYNNFILEKVAVTGYTKESSLFHDGKSKAALQVDDEFMGNFVLFNKPQNGLSDAIKLGKCPRKLSIIASDDEPIVSEISFYWKLPIDPYTGLPMIPRSWHGPGHDNSLGSILSDNLYLLEKYLTDEQRLSLVQELRLAINMYKRKMISCDQRYSCATDEAMLVFAKYDSVKIQLELVVGEMGMYDFEAFSNTLSEIKKFYEN